MAGRCQSVAINIAGAERQRPHLLKAMRVGLRSTTLCSANCSIRTARPLSWPPSGSHFVDRLFAPQSHCGGGLLRADAAPRTAARCGIQAPSCRGARRHGYPTPGIPDAFFDAVVAQFVITAVGDPEATLNRFARHQAWRRDYPGQSS